MLPLLVLSLLFPTRTTSSPLSIQRIQVPLIHTSTTRVQMVPCRSTSTATQSRSRPLVLWTGRGLVCLVRVLIRVQGSKGRPCRALGHLRLVLGLQLSTVVPGLVPLLHYLNGQVQLLSLCLLALLDHLQEGHSSAQVSPQLQHLLVRSLVVLPVLARLHLLCAPPEREIGTVGRNASLVLRLYREDEGVLLEWIKGDCENSRQKYIPI